MSKTLKFNKWFFEPIRNGDKTSTIRTEHKDLCEGDEVTFHIDGKTMNAEIISVERVKYGRLQQYHAISEGYSHVDLLKKELNEIYDDLTDDTPLYIIYFQLDNSNIARQVRRVFDNIIDDFKSTKNH